MPRGDNNTESLVKSLPMWAQVIGYLGLPGAIAGFLVWWITTNVDASIKKVDETLQSHVQATVTLKEHAEQESALHKQTVKLLQQICVGMARDRAGQDRCLQ